ncbi:hypothetical protein C8Q76DRAFT_237358 [Earliella scabrosa]|nr:hypothetical protein C8Q76DRAFT_237358 [Earliella scabrosa]
MLRGTWRRQKHAQHSSNSTVTSKPREKMPLCRGARSVCNSVMGMGAAGPALSALWVHERVCRRALTKTVAHISLAGADGERMSDADREERFVFVGASERIGRMSRSTKPRRMIRTQIQVQECDQTLYRKQMCGWSGVCKQIRDMRRENANTIETKLQPY